MVTRWLIVGSGRCGVQLGRAMQAASITLAGVAVRSERGRRRVRRLLPGVAAVGEGSPLPPADGWLIAVPDDALAACAAGLAARGTGGVGIALHTSGLHGAGVLAPLAEKGVRVGSFHPLMAFPSAGGPAVPLSGALAAVEGDAAAVRAGRALGRALGMVARRVATGDKPLYHAAAAVAANLTHVLVLEAREVLVGIGFDRREATSALRPLVAGAVAAALAASGLERLSGPIARGDAGVVRAHLAALPAALADAYRSVGRLAVARLASKTTRRAVGKLPPDSVLRSLTGILACDSVPADARD